MNLNDVVLIGPGSEWFWSMATGIVLAVTFIAIYRQLRLQAGASAVEQMRTIQREWDTDVLDRHRLAIMLELRDGIDPTKVSMAAASPVADYWERLGYLVRAGHVSATLVHEYNGSAAQYWWRLLEPGIRAARLEISQARLFEHFEWIARRMAEIDRRQGGVEVDRDYMTRLLPRLIELQVEAIRAAEQARGAAVVTPRGTTLDHGPGPIGPPPDSTAGATRTTPS